MGPLERAARALCAIDGVDPDESLGGDGQNFRWMEYAAVNVRAVLQAIREPSEEMKEAYFRKMDELGFHGGMNASCAMETMIDRLLEEGQ